MYSLRKAVRVSRVWIVAGAVGLGGVTTAAGSTTTDVAARLGITPESLVVAGVTTSAATTVLTQMASSQSLLLELAETDEALAIAVSTMTGLSQEIHEGDVDAATSLQLTQTAAQIASLREEAKQIETALFEAATEGLGAVEMQRLNNWRVTDEYRVPPPFRVLSLTAAQWQEVEHALRAEQRALRLEVELDAVSGAVLAPIHENAAVIEAMLRLDTQLSSMTAAFAP